MRSTLRCRSGRRDRRGAAPRIERRPAAPAVRRRIKDGVRDDLHAARRVRVHGGLDRRRRVRDAPTVHRQHRLDRDIGVGVLRQRARSRRRRIDRRPCRGSRSRGSPGSACGVRDPPSSGAPEAPRARRGPRASRAHESPEDVRTMSSPSREGWHHGRVLLEHEQLLGGVAPPAVRMRQMGDELGRRLVVHARHARIAPQPVRPAGFTPS